MSEGKVIEAILLIDDNPETDETEYLLSTEANRRYLTEVLEELKHCENYIYVDPETL